MKKINMNHRVLGLAALFFSTTLLAISRMEPSRTGNLGSTG